MKKLNLLFIFLFLLTISFVSSAPPVTTVQQFPTGLIIQTSPQDYLIQNENYTVNFFVYNSSSGEEVDNTTISCLFYMDNKKGELVVFGNGTYDENDYWDFKIMGGNFSETGQYQFGIKCQDTNLGGTTVGAWEVNLVGREPPTGIIIVVYTILFLIIFAVGIIFFFRALEQFIQFEMDLKDTIYLMVSYFTMWLFYYFSMEYLGNALINDFLSLAISIGAITHVFLALVGFLISFIMSNLKFNQKARITY